MYLGLDLGTSALKAVLVDERHKVVASASEPLAIYRPRDGWSEQNPGDWIEATKHAVRLLARCHTTEIKRLRAIGLSGQMHGAVILDAKGKVIRPAILWNDVRAEQEAMALDTIPEVRNDTGNIVFPGFTAPKINWLRLHEPESYACMRKVLLPKDYLRLWLTGNAVTEMSDASGTSWLDVGKRCWSKRALDATGLNHDHMPSLIEGCAPSGQLRQVVAAELGLPENIVVAGGGGDNAATAIGMGVVDEGDGFLSLGTSGVLFAAIDSFRPNSDSAVHTFCHALPERWHHMGVILSAADSLKWLSSILNASPTELIMELGEKLRAPEPTRFLPYLGGERTPHNDACMRGAFVGLSHGSNRASLVHAVLEGVAFAFMDCQDALSKTGTNIQQCAVVGGGSQSVYWLKLISTVMGIPLSVVENGENAAAIGAARLAMIARGDISMNEKIGSQKVLELIEPDSAFSVAYSDAYCNFKALYPALSDR